MRTKAEYNEYMRKYMLNRYHARRTDAIERLGGKCKVCGSTDSLEIDHVDHTKKSFDVGGLWSCSQKKYDTEIAKCQLLCEKHHIRKTIIERGKKPARGTHGTISAYRYCRCNLCKEAKRKQSAEYRKTHPRKRRRTS